METRKSDLAPGKVGRRDPGVKNQVVRLARYKEKRTERNTLLCQKSASAKHIIAHVDKLKLVEGSVPRNWLSDKDDSIGEENRPLNQAKEPGRTGSEEHQRPLRKRRSRKKPNDDVCSSREMPVDTGPPNDVVSGGTDSLEVTVGRGADLSEEDLTYDRCRGNERIRQQNRRTCPNRARTEAKLSSNMTVLFN